MRRKDAWFLRRRWRWWEERETIFLNIVADKDDDDEEGGLWIGNSSRRLITINFTKEEFQLVPSNPTLPLFLSLIESEEEVEDLFLRRRSQENDDAN